MIACIYRYSLYLLINHKHCTFALPTTGKGQAEHSCTKASHFQKLWVGEPAETRHPPEP